MAFKIDDIRSAVKSHGFMRPDLFVVTFRKQTRGGKVLTDDAESISLFANAIQAPGITHDSVDVQRQGFGPLERRAKGVIFPAIAVTFMCDGQGKVMEFLYNWANRVTSHHIDSGEHSVDEDGGYIGEVGYYDDYVCDMDITLFGEKGRGKKNDDSDTEPLAKGGLINWNLKEVYPQVVEGANLGWKQTDEILELQVQFNYRTFTPSIGEPVTGAGPGDRLNLLQFISKYKGAYEIAKSFKKPQNVGDALNVLNNAKTLGSLFD